MRTNLLAGVAIVAASITSLVVPVAAAGATDEIHCSTTVIGQEKSGEFILDDLQCFSDPAEALAAVEETAASRSASVASVQSTLAVHFDGANYTGSSLTITGISCGGGYVNLSGFWDNRISSTLGVCGRVRHWTGVNISGFYQDTVSSGNLTSLDNLSSSVQYLP